MFGMSHIPWIYTQRWATHSNSEILKMACSTELLAVTEAPKYWLDSKAVQVPEDQVELLSEYI